MKIAMIVNHYPPGLGGLEFHAHNLARGLAKQGNQVWVLTISDSPGRRTEDGVRVLTGRSHLPVAEVISFPSPGARRGITRFLRAHDIDVVSTHTRFFPMSLIGLRAAHAAGAPVIHTEHGSGFVATPSPVIALGSRVVDLTAGRYVLRRAERVLAVSPQAAAFVKRLGGVDADVFYNAIVPSTYTGEIPQRPGRLVFVGRVVAGKGWSIFLNAVAALRSRGMDVEGELLGDGADLAKARRRVTGLGLDGVVAVRGRVSQDEVRRVLRGATLVNPTILSEGFQTTLLEAIAESGRVVTFDVPGARLLRDSGAPVRVCPDRTEESLIETLAGALYEPDPLASPELITKWTWPVRIGEYIQIVEEVVGAHSSNSPSPKTII